MTFKTKPHTFSIGAAPSSRARCRGCKQIVLKGAPRVVTHAFIRPGRSTCFTRHAQCVTPQLAGAILQAYGSIKCVPVEKDTPAEIASQASCAVAARLAERK